MKKTLFLLLTFVIQFASAQSETELQVQNFPVPVFTNSNLSLVILGSAWYNAPLLGDELAVIDSNDEVVGNSVVLQGHNGLAIWGDNPLTKVKDGLFVGERFRIIHWSKNTDAYTLYSEYSTQTGTNSYIKDGFTIVNSVGKAESYTRETAVYYHVKSVLSKRSKYSFYVKEKGVYSLEVRSSSGLLFELKEKFFEKGYHGFNAPSLIPQGAYFINLSSNNKVLTSKSFIVD